MSPSNVHKHIHLAGARCGQDVGKDRALEYTRFKGLLLEGLDPPPPSISPGPCPLDNYKVWVLTRDRKVVEIQTVHKNVVYVLFNEHEQPQVSIVFQGS